MDMWRVGLYGHVGGGLYRHVVWVEGCLTRGSVIFQLLPDI